MKDKITASATLLSRPPLTQLLIYRRALGAFISKASTSGGNLDAH